VRARSQSNSTLNPDVQSSRRREARDIVCQHKKPLPQDYLLSNGQRVYQDMIARLTKHMSHLRNVYGNSCRNHRNGTVVCYNTLESGGPPVHHKRVDAEKWSQFGHLHREIAALRLDRAREVRTRFILIEDLSPPLIEALGSVFWMNPEFFEVHLTDSGYRRESCHDPSLHTWNTHACSKNIVSVKWFRPVQRQYRKPKSAAEREKLVSKNDGTAYLRWLSKDDEEDDWTTENILSLNSNIFRPEWALAANPSELSLGEGSAFPGAWEERATIHSSTSLGSAPVRKSTAPLYGALLRVLSIHTPGSAAYLDLFHPAENVRQR
jgi:hypothetical protein